ncbi:MAG: hypothetical protein L7U72_09500 [Rubripirellula sp.]|nr:hypothetical protein [Rubripirellula sp.]
MRKFKLPHSFPRLSFAVSGITLRQALGPIAASLGILVVLVLFFTGGLSLNFDEGSGESLADAPSAANSDQPADVSLSKPANIVSGFPAQDHLASAADLATAAKVEPSASARTLLVAPSPNLSVGSQVGSAPSRPAVKPVVSQVADQRDRTIGLLVLQFDPSAAPKMEANGVVDRQRFSEWFAGILASFQRFDVVAVHGFPFAWEGLIREELKADQSNIAKWGMVSCDPDVVNRGGQQVAFLWKQARVHCDPASSYLVTDGQHRFSQPPMVASFKMRLKAEEGDSPFRFALIHALPSEIGSQSFLTSQSVGSQGPISGTPSTSPIEDVYLRVRKYEFEKRGEEDCILVGQWDGGHDAGHASSGEFVSHAKSALAEHSAIAEHLVELVRPVVNLTERGLEEVSNLHLLFDRRYSREYSGEYSGRSRGESVGATGRTAASDLLSESNESHAEFRDLGFTGALFGEFSASETPRFESTANGPTGSLLR